MSNWGKNTLKETLDVIRLIWYNKNINVMLRKNVFHRPQLQPLETPQKRGKLTGCALPILRGLSKRGVQSFDMFDE